MTPRWMRIVWFGFGVVWLVVGIVSFVLGEPLWGVVGLALGVALTLNGVFRKRWRRSV